MAADQSIWADDGRAVTGSLGVIAPHLDKVPESELAAMAPPGLSLHGARVPLGMIGPDGEIVGNTGPAVIQAFADSPLLDDAVSMLADAAVGAILVCFTSASYVYGRDGEERLLERLHRRAKGIPVLLAAQAMTQALRQLQATKIVLLHPPWFSEESSQLGDGYFGSFGIEVLACRRADLPFDDFEFDPEALFSFARSAMEDDADALVFGGSGFRVASVLQALENDLGKPVLGSNQASLWRALTVIGCREAIEGYGELLSKR